MDVEDENKEHTREKINLNTTVMATKWSATPRSVSSAMEGVTMPTSHYYRTDT
jgi:hypothetical protein